jgi:hypothetical protein
MDNYIICEKRSNLPRIHVKICQHRCEHAKDCQAFQDYVKAQAPAEMVVRPATGDWPGEKGIPLPTP